MAPDEDLSQEDIQKIWYTYLVEGNLPDYVNAPWYTDRRFRGFFRHVPTEPRCNTCYYPFNGIGGTIMRSFFDIKPSTMNPRICNICEQFAKKYKGGAEIDLTILFADVRGSTRLAHSMKPTEYSQLINRFFKAAISVLYDTGALVEKVIGDAVTGFYTPGFTKSGPARAAVKAALRILDETGHGKPSGPWIPVGIGIQTGRAYVGTVDTNPGIGELVVLGDTANLGARLASEAAAGEVVISPATALEAGIDKTGVEIRKMGLKGFNEPVEAWILKP